MLKYLFLKLQVEKMASFVCWVYFTAIKSHLYIKR